MKILFITPPLHGDNDGGIQAAGRIAWDALRSRHDAQLLELPPKRRWDALHRARAQTFQADLLLFWHLDLLRLAPVLRSKGRRAVFLHGIEAWRRRGPLTTALVKNCAILANSQCTLTRARPYFRCANFQDAEVVHLGIGAPATTQPAPSGAPSAIMISRLDAQEQYKGHREVIDAWPDVLQRMPDAQLLIVGEGDLRPALEAQASGLNLLHSVRFLGRVSEGEKESLLHTARCLAMPSRAEGFGLVYLESMRVGRPCIVGADAGPEVVNPPQGGLAVDPDDRQQIAHALITLLTHDELWQQRSQAARQRYERGYTAAHFQARFLGTLERIR
ncbi:MAG TPA: glycosyltransferase family 4 protein [Longimicrobiales bacterium]|nr:glycosyltransferase family 4 protein [Longimicrobiales bacterium]